MKRGLLLFFVFCYSFGSAQCELTGLSSPSEIIVCGSGSQTINYDLVAHNAVYFDETFDCPGPCYPFSGSADVSNPYLPSPTNDTYIFTTPPYPLILPRSYTTQPFDFSLATSGKLSFDFIYANSSGILNGPDQFNEGIEVQYTIDGGITWQSIIYYSPTGYTLPSMPISSPGPTIGNFYSQWTQICLDIPTGAFTSLTQFRFVQINASGYSFDHWGLDNIKVTANDPTYNYFLVNDNSNLGAGPISGTLIANADTSFIFLSTDGISSFYDTLNVQFSTPDSIYIISTTQPTSASAFDGTITIGGLSIGAEISLSLTGVPGSFGLFQMSNTLAGLPSDTYYIEGVNSDDCLSNIISTTIIAINNPPIAVDDTEFTDEDVQVTIDVQSNDTDLDNNIDSSTLTLVSLPANGVVTLNPVTYTYNYAPDPSFNGADTLMYSICDFGFPVLCDTAFLYINVTPVNDAPIAVNDMATTYLGFPIVIVVASNDYDVDPSGGIDATSITEIIAAFNGTLVVDPVTGEFTYTPDPNFIGLDSFTYSICDIGNPLPALCDTAQVNINVLDLSIEGTITTSLSTPLLNSKVYLIDYITATDSVFLVDSTVTNTSGFYQFPNAFQNAYVKAVPNLSNYPNEILTYYTSSSVFQASNNISLTSGITNVSFSTIAGVNPGGNGFIGGIVGNGAGKNSEVGEPISGLSLLLMNENMEVVKQTTTDVLGQFSFDNIEEVEYSLWVDKAGVNNSIAPLVSLLDEGSKENLQFILHEDYLEYRSTVSIKNISESKFEIYPNPTNGLLYINSLKDENFEIEILNILGESVYQNTFESSESVIDLSDNNLSKGTYFIKLKMNNKVYIKKVFVNTIF